MVRILGIDEAGRGPVIGPMVIVGFLIEDSQMIKLEKISPKDSKAMTKHSREKIFNELLSLGETEIVIIPANEIDESLRTININTLELITFSKIINKLKPDKAFIDALGNIDSSIEFIRANLIPELKDIEITMEQKADSKYIVVSAASVIAKVIRDKEIDKIKDLAKKYNIDVDLGSGYSSDPKTIKFLNHIIDSNNIIINKENIIRKEWETFKRINKKNNKNKDIRSFLN